MNSAKHAKSVRIFYKVGYSFGIQTNVCQRLPHSAPTFVPIQAQASANRSDAPAVFYGRVPGLLACAAWDTIGAASGAAYGTYPLAVTRDNVVRDLCPLAVQLGVRVGQPERHARRLCLTLHVVSASDIDPRHRAALSERFLRPLADYTDVIEPDGADAAYCDFTAGVLPKSADLTAVWTGALQTGFAPHIGWGTCRNAARACAEDNLTTDALFCADARHLWPEDPSVYARLFRLGLTTYGAVAAIGESALVYQFGRKGRLLYARSCGHDFTPVRALYPPPDAVVRYDFSQDPLSDEASLMHHIGCAASAVSQELRRFGRHARRMALGLVLETGNSAQATRPECEWVLPAPIQAEADVLRVLRRLRRQLTVTAPVQAVSARASDCDLPSAATGSLFDSRAAERAAALAATRQKLSARYGVVALRRGEELIVPRRETRRRLRQEKRGV